MFEQHGLVIRVSKMFEEDFGPFGILFYVIVMLLFFSIPIIVGLVSGFVVIHFKRKLKTGIALWSTILCSPILLILILDFYQRAVKNAWNTLYGESWTYTLYMAAITLPFVVPVWILGALLLYFIGRPHPNSDSAR